MQASQKEILRQFVDAKIRAKPRFDLEAFLFKEQLLLARDPAKFATAVCSVRAGKTITCAADLIDTCLNKSGVVCLYITLARSSAKRIIWPELHKINRDYQLEGVPNESDLSFKFPNGSIIYCSGASDATEIEKFRGLSNVALGYIDECFHGETIIETAEGGVAIKDVRAGDYVKNASGFGRVSSLSKKHHKEYVTLRYGGTSVKCSLNHPFFTINGWVAAKDLKTGDLLARQTFCVRILQKEIYEDNPREQALSFLRSELLREISKSKNKSDEQHIEQDEGVQNPSSNGPHATHQKRQWDRPNRIREKNIRSNPRSLLELCRRAWKASSGISHQLQARLGLSRFKNRHRDRWAFSFSACAARPGQEERKETDFIRLDDTSIQECRNDPTNVDGLFYDIEVEGHPSFTVNGALVHNCQAFRSHIRELVEEILIKRLYDTNGRLRLIGTPGPLPAGYFYEASQSDQWSHHAWTLHANPWIERKAGCTVAQLIAQDCARKGVGLDDPSIQRECFGRWVLDSNSLLLEYKSERNHYDVLPKGNYVYILGMDFGYEDADAFSVLGWREGSPDTYLVEELIAAKQTYEQMVANFEMLHKKYPLSKVVADPGGGGKKLIESLRPRYAIPMQPADKLGKIANYGLLNNALRTGRFFARRDSRFAQDCNLLERDKDKSTPERIVVKGHSDAVDSVLYPFRESPAYGYTPPPPVLKPGTPEWSQDQEDKMREHLYKTIKAEQDEMKEWNGYGQYY